MKSLLCKGIPILLVLSPFFAFTQNTSDQLDKYIGEYYVRVDTNQVFIIKKEKAQLILSIPGQGQTSMKFISNNIYQPAQVKPEAFIEFVPDSAGKIQKLLWKQDQNMDIFPVKKNQPPSMDSISSALSEYTGEYRSKKPANNIWIFKEENSHLTAKINNEPQLELEKISNDHFIFKTPDFQLLYDFKRNASGELTGATFRKTGGVDLLRRNQSQADFNLANHISNRKNGFTRADTLQGTLGPFRSCYDVIFYHLDIRVFPENKSLEGSNLIRFKVLSPSSTIQVDLYKNMKIERIRFKGTDLNYTREYNAVFVQFPEELRKGDVLDLQIFFAGIPQQPDLSIPMHGGFLWLKDKNGNPWIESVCQGSGASLWWPCKDHLSDKPDSMAISITVPKALMDISNGRLLQQTDLPDNLTRFDWWVSYPIINYDVAVNIGVYTHYAEEYKGLAGSYPLNFYCMPSDLEKAKELFSKARPMLQLYEHSFGPYPFPKDGFTLMESLYPMEHQSAVSIGQINTKHFDAEEMERLMRHETAHEWWGNSVSCKDMADLWIHEAFATYSEYLKSEAISGKVTAMASLNKQKPANKEPVVGVYNVNHIHYDIGDMYAKGSLMLNTLRNVINNDSTWFDILRGLQEKFRYQSVTTEDITSFITEKTKTDYTYFFDQYLRQATIPELQIRLSVRNTSLVVEYRWDSCVSNFHMPVKITRSKNNFDFITPNTSWQTLDLGKMNPKDFKVATDEFYIRVWIDRKGEMK